MEKYVSPKAEFIDFGNEKLNTGTSNCNCIAIRWNYAEGDWDSCTVTTGDFSEVGDANNGL